MNRRANRNNAGPGAVAALTPVYRPRQVRKAAPCQAGCPNCSDIREWIGTVAQRRKTGLGREEAYAKAWRTIADVNPFPAVLGRICPHPCEANCNRAELDEPLAINAMERFLGDFAIAAGLPLPRAPAAKVRSRLGVVGAGPSGLSFAYQMARRGHRVTVYDAREKAGGMLRYGVPEYRLPTPVLDAEIQRILALGVDLRLNVRVGKDVSLDALRQRHSCLYLAIGAQKGRGLDVPGAAGTSVWTGTDYLARMNRGEAIDLGETVVVVGGGNTAVDAARCARRSGAGVVILYRRSLDEMPAIAREVEEAVEEGVRLMLLCAPVRVLRGDDGRLTGVSVQRMRLGAPDSSGRQRPEPISGSGFDLQADSVIAAISQAPVLEGLEMLHHHGDWLVADSVGALADGVMGGGDELGLGIAGDAIVQGRRAAEQLHERLQGGNPGQARREATEEISSQRVLLASKAPCGAAHTPQPPGQERVRMGMAEVSRTISEEQFLAEVERCFSCGACCGCEQCFMYCTADCFTRLENPRPGTYFELDTTRCKECGKCIEVCPCGYLEEG